MKSKTILAVGFSLLAVGFSFQNCAKVNFKSLEQSSTSPIAPLAVNCKFNGVTYPINSRVFSYKVDALSSQALCDANTNKIQSVCNAPGVWEPPVNPFSSCQVIVPTGNSCTPGDSVACVIDNGRGKKTCGADKNWGVCTPVTCNFGFSVNTNLGKCIPSSCTPGAEVVCNKTTTDSTIISIGTGLCANTGTGVVSCTDMKCLDPAQNFAGTTPPTCKISCTPGSQRSCHDRNGFGYQSCQADGASHGSCVLSSCDDGFTFDSATKSCVNQTCSAGTTKTCTTADGLNGVYVCNADNHYSTVCQPTSCPNGYDLTSIDGINKCVIKLCTGNQVRNNSGVCVSPSPSPVSSPSPASSPTPVSSPTPMTSPTITPSGSYSWDASSAFGNCSATPTYSYSTWGTCSSAGQQTRTYTCINTTGTQTRVVPCKNSSGQVVADSNCSSANKPAVSQDCTLACVGTPTIVQSCTPPPAKTCNVNGKPVNAGAFDIAAGFKSANSVPGEACIPDNYTGYCDGTTGQPTFTKQAASPNCNPVPALNCIVNGKPVPAGPFDKAYGFKSASPPAGTNCVADNYVGFCDGATGVASISKYAAAATCVPQSAKTCTVNGQTVPAGPYNLPAGYTTDWVPANSSCDLNRSAYVGNCDPATGIATNSSVPPFNSCSMELVPSCSFTTGSTNLLVGEILSTKVKSYNAYGIQYSLDGTSWNTVQATTVNQPLDNDFNLVMSNAGSSNLTVRALSRSGIPTNCSAGLLASVPVNVMSGKVSLNSSGTTNISVVENQAFTAIIATSSNVNRVDSDCGAGYNNSYSTTNGTQIFAGGTYAVGVYNCKNRIVAGSFIREINSISFTVTAMPDPVPSRFVDLYQCPGETSLGGGAWGFYGCQGQISNETSCYQTEWPKSQSYSCTALNRAMPIYSSGSILIKGAKRAVQMYQCPGQTSLGGGAWGYYGCQGQVTDRPTCYQIEWPKSQTYNCTPIGFSMMTDDPMVSNTIPQYQCPGQTSLGGGAWGYYGCQGQMTNNSTCKQIEYPKSANYSCSPVGNLMLVNKTAPPAPPLPAQPKVYTGSASPACSESPHAITAVVSPNNQVTFTVEGQVATCSECGLTDGTASCTAYVNGSGQASCDATGLMTAGYPLTVSVSLVGTSVTGTTTSNPNCNY